MTQRELDMRAEKSLAAFLDAHFYSGLLKEGGFTSFQRVTDKDQQKQGIDVVAKSGDSVAYIDEKAQLHYINKTLPTFAFELEFLFNGSAMAGWFLNGDLKTTHYMLLWPNARTADLSELSSADFTQVEGLMISKAKMKQRLDEVGLDDAFLKKVVAALRQKGHVGSQSTAYDGIKFFVSPSTVYSENPVNMVISKKILMEFADAHYMILRSGFVRVTSGKN